MRHKTSLTTCVIGSAVALLLLGAGGGEPDKQTKDGMTVFFRDSNIESVAAQELATYPDDDAGEAKKLERAFPDAPPQVPHTVEDMLPITLDDNECLECHDPENAIGKDDVPLPKTHFRQAVMGKGAKDQGMVWVVKGYEDAAQVAGSRYNCSMCHTPQSDNARTIGTTFGRVAGKPTQ